MTPVFNDLQDQTSPARRKAYDARREIESATSNVTPVLSVRGATAIRVIIALEKNDGQSGALNFPFTARRSWIWHPITTSKTTLPSLSEFGLIGIPVTSHTFKPKLLTGSILSASLELQYSPAAKYHPMWRFPSTFDAGFNRQSRVQ